MAYSDELDRMIDYWYDIKGQIGAASIWSIYEVKDAHQPADIAIGAKTLVYTTHWGPEPVAVNLTGNTWLDLYRAADEAIRQSGDEHHIFIEEFVLDGDTLELHTGS